MIPYRILLQNGAGETVDVIAGHLDAALWEMLRAFREEAERLSACAWVAAGLPGSYRLHFDRDGTHVEEPDAPSEAATREVIHCLRPFVLQSERLYFPRVSGNLYKAFTHSALRARIAESRDTYQYKGAARHFTITRNILELTSDKAFDLWIDAFEYHRHGKDQSRKLRFLELHGGPPDAMTLAVLRDALRHKVFAIKQLAGFVRSLEESPTFRRYLAEQSCPNGAG